MLIQYHRVHFSLPPFLTCNFCSFGSELDSLALLSTIQLCFLPSQQIHKVVLDLLNHTLVINLLNKLQYICGSFCFQFYTYNNLSFLISNIYLQYLAYTFQISITSSQTLFHTQVLFFSPPGQCVMSFICWVYLLLFMLHFGFLPHPGWL